MIEHSNREAREISERAGDIYNTVCLLGDRLYALGNSISTTANKYNDVVKATQGKQGLLGKVSRFQSLSQRANKSFPDTLAPIEPDVETARLEDIKDDQPPAEESE
jgi:DNA recombination protein RmuC